jgi:nitrogen fixation-related uncharacterized protein
MGINLASNKTYIVPKGLENKMVYLTRPRLIIKAWDPNMLNSTTKAAYIISYRYDTTNTLQSHCGFFTSNSHLLTLDLDTIQVGQYLDQSNDRIQQIQMTRQSLTIVDYVTSNEGSIRLTGPLNKLNKNLKGLKMVYYDADMEKLQEFEMSQIFKSTSGVVEFAHEHYILAMLIVIALLTVCIVLSYFLYARLQKEKNEQFNSFEEQTIDKNTLYKSVHESADEQIKTLQ